MKNLLEIVKATDEYTQAYCKQYQVENPELVKAIWISHLAYLVNQS